jgi:hypothetical protein
MAVEIDGAVQQAPQLGRQFMAGMLAARLDENDSR